VHLTRKNIGLNSLRFSGIPRFVRRAGDHRVERRVNAPLNGELLRQRLVGGAIKKKKTKNAPPNNPLEPRVASPSDSVRRQPAPLGSARR